MVLDRDPLDLVERNLILSAVIKLGGPRRFVVGDLLGHFQLAAVLQIRRDAGRAEGMIADPRFDGPLHRTFSDSLGSGVHGALYLIQAFVSFRRCPWTKNPILE